MRRQAKSGRILPDGERSVVGLDAHLLVVDGKQIAVNHPGKFLWSTPAITKLEYVEYLLLVAPCLLPYTRDRLLMMWRYPDGPGTKRIEEKAVPSFAPEWVPRAFYKDKDWILLNDAATLAWVGSLAALELHVPFDRHDRPNFPTELVFDLDPPGPGYFELVREVALALKDVLDSLGLFSVAKTSGATGLQVHIPVEPVYTFDQARRINRFVAEYLLQTLPGKVTLERVVSRRGTLLYVDYLQLWKMRTMPAPYSTRALPGATVSTPVSWQEIQAGFRPNDFTIQTVGQRLRQQGDLFTPVSAPRAEQRQRLDTILAFIESRGL